MTIGRFARAAGVGVETVRYYQRRGLLAEPARNGGNYREYGAGELRALVFIRRAQAAGFTLEEIRELLRLDGGTNRARVREIAGAKLKELEARIRELRHAARVLDALLHDCEHGDRRGRCPIIESFELEA